MEIKKEFKILFYLTAFFLFAYFMPIEKAEFMGAIYEALYLVKWYAQEHVLLCLIPAFFIAGIIAVFISQGAVIKYFGANATRWKSYLVASVSGTVLAVCSCTILPLFSGIHKRGAGLGPAIAFLYSGPAINILAIILTARILGFEIGLARVIGAVIFAVVIGLLMAFIFRKDEKKRTDEAMAFPEVAEERPIWQTSYHFFILVFILVFANWGRPDTSDGSLFWLWDNKWLITAVFGVLFVGSLIFIIKLNKVWVIAGTVVVALSAAFFPDSPVVPFTMGFVALSIIIGLTPGEPREWLWSTWGFTKQIVPLLFAGVMVAGFLLGSPEGTGQGIIPNEWVANLVGGNSVFANLFASIFGAFMYFATLTEVPIIQGLLNSGMGKGPALALLLAGPALSLPNMLVIHSVIGTKKTTVFITLVVVMATISGLIFGTFFP